MNGQRILILIAATVVFVSAFSGLAVAQTPLFTAPRDFAVGENPPSVAVGNFNGDNRPDLAVANYNSNTVSILLGQADGTFRPGVTLAVEFRAPDGKLPVEIPESGYDIQIDSCQAGLSPHGPQRSSRARVQYTRRISEIMHVRAGTARDLQ